VGEPPNDPTIELPGTGAPPAGGGGSGGGGSTPPGPLGRAGLPERYEKLDLIGAGTFGEVWRVLDRVLDRALAMKMLRLEYAGSPQMRARFLTEARITAGLQHPGIVAVHDQGELEDRRLWFTMKEVRGRTLRAVIDEVHASAGPDSFRETPGGWTFRRLVDAFARIAQAVAYAHDHGVVHRDLKPENLMTGEFGEVLVMDWGLARRLSDPAAGHGVDPPSVSRMVDDSQITQHGDVLGTPAYMSPEQARGENTLVGPASDVYSLGAILYHLLAGRPPYDGSAGVVLQQIRGTKGPMPLDEATQGQAPVPAELVAVSTRAMQRAIADRYPDAGALARDVVAFLDGARRREQALHALESAQALEPSIAALRERSLGLRREAEAVLGALRPFDPIDRKRPGWALEDEAARLTRDAALRETQWLQKVHGALSLYPDLAEAHAVLADHYRERLSAAEIAHHDEDAARFEALLDAHDRGRHAAFLRGEGAITLVTDPPGAEVLLERYELRDRRLVPVPLGSLGRTPLVEVPLTRGSYRLRLRAPGRAEALYPVLIERGGHWDGRAPGDVDPYPIALLPEDELGPDDVYVPAGWCWTGGDQGAVDRLPARRLWIDAFVIRRFPVTNREYLTFLNELVAAGREVESLTACPRPQIGMGDSADGQLAFGRDPGGRFLLDQDYAGRRQQPDWPVALVDWDAAKEYARWLAGRTGSPWRLPNELEREKAARGADGRLCPWGDHLDATFTCSTESNALAPPAPVSVASYPLDESPYGVRGLAGNSRDWCINPWRRSGPVLFGARLVLDEARAEDEFRAVRGGAWSSQLEWCRSAARFGNKPTLRRASTGLRVARSLRGTG
jgi:serine/threonine protein kinase/formylglycine-generating enzyme required for sulfatase activity